MGLMQGKVMGDSLVIMDSFALPVQGTETRVNAAEAANEYMVEYIRYGEKVRYHSIIYRSTIIELPLPPDIDREKGEFDRMVSFSSWIWMLAIRN